MLVVLASGNLIPVPTQIDLSITQDFFIYSYILVGERLFPTLDAKQ